MEVKNNYITVAYKMYAKEFDSEKEELQEECTAEHPFAFITNLRTVLPKFEEEIMSLAPGAAFNFVIPAKDAYGEFDEKYMFDVEKKLFMRDGKFDSENIFEGNIIMLQGEDGSRFNAIVIEVKDDAVTIDLNHPHAGQDLRYEGVVIDNREATPEELNEYINQLGGCHCGGGCGGNCGGGCGGDCGGDGCGDGCGNCNN